jgi:hypothetical protein
VEGLGELERFSARAGESSDSESLTGTTWISEVGKAFCLVRRSLGEEDGTLYTDSNRGWAKFLAISAGSTFCKGIEIRGEAEAGTT